MQRNRRREPISFMHWGAGPQCNLDEKHFFLCERPGWNLCKRRPLSRKSRKPSSRRNIYAMASPSSELRETRAAWAGSQVKNTSTKGRDWLCGGRPGADQDPNHGFYLRAAMRNSASSRMGEPLLGLALIGLRRPWTRSAPAEFASAPFSRTTARDSRTGG